MLNFALGFSFAVVLMVLVAIALLALLTPQRKHVQ